MAIVYLSSLLPCIVSERGSHPIIYRLTHIDAFAGAGSKEARERVVSFVPDAPPTRICVEYFFCGSNTLYDQRCTDRNLRFGAVLRFVPDYDALLVSVPPV